MRDIFMEATMLTALLLASTFNVHGQDQVIGLYDGPAPGSEQWDWQESFIEQAQMSYNIVSPSLTVYRAAPEAADGRAVIICPGGGFHFLSMENEGQAVAKWLQEKGITAFVLKYRTEKCLTDNPIQEFMQKNPNTPEFNKAMEPIIAMAIADGKAAVAHVREHAGEWGIKKDRIGIMGFSAGGTVTAGTAFTYDHNSRPDFAAPIYPYVGSFGDPPVPGDAPPLFIACASDDFFGFQAHCTKLYTQWNEAGKSAELLIYRKGGHGFGMRKQNLPTDDWIERFYQWLTHLDK
jgi:acetyl esterase/lipase